MRIASRLLVGALVPALMALVAVVGAVASYYSVAELQTRQAVAIELPTDLSDLDFFARSYLLHHDERARRQFDAKAAEIAERVDSVSFGDPANQRRLGLLEDDLAIIRSLFARLVANYEQSASATGTPVLREAEERLSAQLFIRLDDANGTTAGLVRAISDEIVVREQRVSLLVGVFAILAAAVLTFGLLRLRQGVTRSLALLRDGTEAIGAGDLDHRIGLPETDELGQLGASFERMSRRLKLVTVSRDELEREVGERKSAEERANQELETTALLLQAAHAISDWTDLQRVTQGLAEILLKVTVHTRATVQVWDDVRREIEVVASEGEMPLTLGRRWTLDDVSAGALRALLDGQTGVWDVDRLPEDQRGVLAPEYHVRRALFVPLSRRDKVIGLIVIDDPDDRRDFSEREMRLVEGIAAQAGVVIENARLFGAEKTRRRRIEALHGVTEVAMASLDLRDSARSILQYLTDHHAFDLANVWMARGDGLELLACTNYPPAYEERYSPMPLSAPYDAPKVFATGVPVVVPDIAEANPAVRDLYHEIGVEIGAYIIQPLRSRGRIVGTLHFGWREPHEMTPEDLDFYASLGSELGVVLENARLYETERDIADRLQEALLSLPESLPGIEYAHAYHSATEAARVGGDFYDLFEIERDLVGVTIGDVAGKGLDAAVLTSLVKNSIRAHASEKGATPARILELTNDVVYQATPSEAFVTVFFGVLDRLTGRLVYANAGHTTAAVVRPGVAAVKFPVTGPILGAFKDVRFGQQETGLGPEEVLFLYTDGLTEARSAGGLFGEERVFEFLAGVRDGTPSEMVRGVIAEVLEFTGGSLSDDLALLALTRREGGEGSLEGGLDA